eukprot:350331-Chlamydomonas_euryale.AAC.5
MGHQGRSACTTAVRAPPSVFACYRRALPHNRNNANMRTVMCVAGAGCCPGACAPLGRTCAGLGLAL